MIWTLLALVLMAIAGILVLLRGHEPELPPEDRLVSEINAFLPQTQCRQCGYPGCLPYAKAIVSANAPIDRCPPGGQVLQGVLGELLGRSGSSSNRVVELAATSLSKVAVIDESACIGCVKCLQVCPVDAIVGAAKQMHTVISEECTGCELCIEPCPVDCIFIVDSIIDVAQETKENLSNACIRCGDCLPVCPVGLQPQQLFDAARTSDIDLAQELHLFDCIDCGCCAYVCPSEIPLVHYFRNAKSSIEAMDRDRAVAERARGRHEMKSQRLLEQSKIGVRSGLELADVSALNAGELQRDIKAAVSRSSKRRQNDNDL